MACQAQVGTTADRNAELSSCRVGSRVLSFTPSMTRPAGVNVSATALPDFSSLAEVGEDEAAPPARTPSETMLLHRHSIINGAVRTGSQQRTLDIGSWTLPGNRYSGLNQDFMVVQELYTPGEIPRDGQQAYVVAICDGHGILGDKSACFAGKALARHLYCSATLRNKVLAKLPSDEVQQEVCAAFKKAHTAACLVYDMPPKLVTYPATVGAAKLSEFGLVDVGGMKVYRTGKGHEKMLECGTTCTAALIQGRCVCLANVGDSSAVLGREEPAASNGAGPSLSAEVVSVRHHGLLPAEAERVKAQYAATTEVLHDGYLRVLDGPWAGYELSVTRALGHRIMEQHGVLYEPHCMMLDLRADHCCLIIGSDGLWDVLSPEQAVQHVMEGRRQGKTAAQVARSLVERAVKEGLTPAPLSSPAGAGVVPDDDEPPPEQDNTSAIVVFWGIPSITSS